MGYAEDKFWDYLRKHLILMQNIRVDELLVPLSARLTPTTVERLNAYVRNQGNRSTVLDFCFDLSRCDDWVNHLINALEYCGHQELASKFLQEYSKHRLTLSSPRSFPPSTRNHNQHPPHENPQGACSLPGPMPPSSQEDTLPGPSPKPVQPEREKSPNSASGHNQEFRSLPPLPNDPPSPPRATLAHSVSEPIQSERTSSEDKMPRTPVPETSPHQTAPSEGDILAFQKVPDTGTYSPTSGGRGADDGRGRPAQDERDALLSQVASHPEQPVSPNTAHSIRETTVSEVYHDVQSADPVSANHPEQPASPPPAHSVREKVVSRVQTNAQSTHQAAANHPEQPASPPPAHSIREKGVSRVQHDAQSAHQVAANRLEQPTSPPPAHSIREKVVSRAQDDAQSAHQVAANRPEQPASAPPAHSARGHQDAQSAHQVPYGSSCRPLQTNNDEAYFSKPGVLLSTPGFGDDSNDDGESSESSSYALEISERTERSESSNRSHRSSPTSATQRESPLVSTPNNRSMEVPDRGSPEENDFTFDRSNTSNSYKSSPGGNRRLDQSSSKQPEENSFGSKDVSHYRLDFNEGPDAELLEGNDNGLRNRPRKIPNPNKTDDRSTEETCSRGRDHERKVLITITVVSVCLSLYLLWKNRHN